MVKIRNLLVVSIAVVMMILMTSTWVSAQPVQQGTVTPEATTPPTDTPAPTVAATEAPTTTATATAVAPAVSPLGTPSQIGTPIGTPSTLPTTGAGDDGTGVLSLLLIAVGAVILVSILGLTMSRRSR
jgi:hypothetical protein